MADLTGGLLGDVLDAGDSLLGGIGELLSSDEDGDFDPGEQATLSHIAVFNSFQTVVSRACVMTRFVFGNTANSNAISNRCCLSRFRESATRMATICFDQMVPKSSSRQWRMAFLRSQ